MKTITIQTIILVLLCLFPFLQYGQSFTKQGEVFSSGSERSSGGNYSNFGILGEPITNPSIAGGNFTSNLGFIYKTSILSSELCIDFGSGYTWFSVNVDPGSFEWNDLFQNLDPCNDDRIIGQNNFVVFNNGTWIYNPVFSELEPDRMYIMKLCNSQEWCIQGQPVPVDQITLNPGYTWIGYTPQATLPINTALNISPTPAIDDRLGGQYQFAAYTGTQWIGGLSELVPGEGYKIKLTNGGLLNYGGSDENKNSHSMKQDELYNPLNENINQNYQYTMNIVCKVILPNGGYASNPNDA
ncbi:MAG: hypothetical protein HQ541_16700 [Mariniphaga sp.]|nr:hypothetical protein [Mariniphaga sp.]